jgi:acyl-CoA synthetase (AMP-forming)/AMP-acid ligase II/lauroyl/myristoyl acyltransferase/acyl carrier protein
LYELIDFTREEIEGTIGDRLHRVAAKIPNNIAVQTADSKLKYAELDQASEVLAKSILARRGPAEEPVAMLMEQGTESVAAMMGIFKAGKSAVILAPDFPASKLSAFWENAGKPLILTCPLFHALASEICGTPDGWLDLSDSRDRTFDLESIHIRPDSAATLLYTSGTTGEAKGLILSHRLYLHTAWNETLRYQITEHDRVALIAAHGYGASIVLSIYTILGGAGLHFLTGNIHRLNPLVEYLRREEITLLMVPSFTLLQQLADSMTERVDLPHLRTVLIGGGELHRPLLQRFRDFFPKSTEFTFRLAASETLTISELRIAPNAPIPWEKIPVGRVFPDKELLLLDDHQRPVAPGKIGEIAIRSRYLADGYWQRPDLTKEKFLPDPEGGDRRICLTGDIGRLLPDGMLEHMGRKDNMVRVRGFSIQLEAVERALLGLPGVKEAAAASVSFADGDNRLVGYIVPSDAGRPSLRNLHNGLAAILQPQMIPTMFVFLEAIPRTLSNRVDRQALPPPGSGRPDLDVSFVQPRNELEQRLCLLWAKTTGVDRVGIDDDFFLLGGDSLLAMHMVLHVEEQLNRSIPSTFFRTPTIRHLVELWQSEEKKVVAGSNRRTKDALSGEKSLIHWKIPIPFKYKRKKNIPRNKKRYILHRRIVRLAVEFITANLSYPQGCRWISWWCRQPFVIDHFYPAEKELFRRWVLRLGGCPQAPADALNLSLLSNILWSRELHRTIPYKYDTFLESLRHSYARFFRDMARIISEAPTEVLDRYFDMEGLEHVEHAQRQGRGVILVSYHGVCNRFSVITLPRRLHGSPIPTLGPTHGEKLARKNQIVTDLEANEPAILANVAVEGLRLLKQGGIVQIAPDIGYDATEGVPVTISGFRFLMKPGFAELALLSDAVVIPCYTTRTMDGCLHTRFDPPLDPGNAAQDRQARISHLLEQYAAFVGNAWRKAPESLLWYVIRKHLRRPTAEA